MFAARVLYQCRIALFSLAIVPLAHAATEDQLTLIRAEQLALEQAPSIARLKIVIDASSERLAYEGRLPDPQLTLGAINVPTDSFSLRDEDMTMSMIGVRQTFPPGDTLQIRTQRAKHEQTREQTRLEIERRNILKQVRTLWLDLYLTNQSLMILDATRQLARRDLEATEGRYRAAQENQRKVFIARQALAQINEREPMLRAQVTGLRAQLQRFIGASAYNPLPTALPTLPAFTHDFDLTHHPEWLAVQAELDISRTEIEIAREEYKPGMMFDLSYGFRQSAPTGTTRSDMVTAMITFDLPIFPAKRQDRRVSEKQKLAIAAEFETEDKRRELEAMYAVMRAEYDAMATRVRIVEEQLLPNIRRETQVTIAGFAREQDSLREARMKELDTNLELLRLRVELAKIHAGLLYLIGEAT